jgi:hypothetical protein
MRSFLRVFCRLALESQQRSVCAHQTSQVIRQLEGSQVADSIWTTDQAGIAG